MNLRIILDQYPQCLESRAKLSAILRDLYPSERRQINIVLDIYECGIADKIKQLKSIDALQVQAFCRQLEVEYALPAQYALRGLALWLEAYNVAIHKNEVPAKDSRVLSGPTSFESNVSQDSENVYQIVNTAPEYELKVLTLATAEISQYYGHNSKNVIIPSTIDGKNIVGIGKGAFQHCTTIEYLRISEGIRYIEDVPEAPAPTRWLQFLNELLYEEDIPALQEYIGYCLLPVTKAQKMLLMVGKGGEGKSRIGLILRELFGSSMYTGSLQKVETNRFARADLEYKLLLVDDDMKTEALPQTNNIKTLVTLEDKIDIERKGQQSVQGTLYVRFACFGNGSLHALYDKSNGFYRRQLLLTTKEKPVGRVDDPFLIDKMRGEKEGILLWALEGLHRLIRNNYQFTISERTTANLKEAMEQGNNILGFLKSEGYFEIRQGAKCKSTDFYKVYERWCMDNLEKPLAASTFIHHLKDNQKSLGIVYDDKCIGTNRGFHNVDVDLFLPVDVPSPWDKKIELT